MPLMYGTNGRSQVPEALMIVAAVMVVPSAVVMR